MIMCTGPTTRHVKRLEIKALWEQGLSQRDIAKRTKQSLPTVNRWTQRFAQARESGESTRLVVLDKPRHAAPLKITPAIGKAMIAYAEGNANRPAPMIRTYIQKHFGVTVTDRRIRQYLNEQGLTSFSRDKEVRLEPEHKAKRVRFARAHLDLDWSNTLFTDEAEFSLYPLRSNTRDDRVWARRKSDVPAVKADQFSPKVQCWGGISEQGKTRLIFYEGGLGAEKYRDKILKKAKPDFAAIFGAGNTAWTFVHDGAAAHKADMTNTWIDENVPNYIPSGPNGDWPAKSSDLNIVEQIWGIMTTELQAKKPPPSLEALKRRMKQIWDELD